MSFPTTSILDDFNRANETPIAGNWTLPFTTNSESLNLSSNSMRYAGTVNLTASAYWNPTTYGPDCEVFVTDLNIVSSGFVRLILRGTNPGNAWNGYSVAIPYTGSAQFLRSDNGTATQLSTFTGPSLRPGQSVGFRMTGSLMTAYLNDGSSSEWRSLGSTYDPTYTTAGFIGIEISGQSTHGLDNFGGGNVSVSPPPAIASISMGGRGGASW